MPIRYSIAQRTPLLNGLFAGLACALTLALTAGPALAQTAGLDRVEISGHVIEAPARYDVRASCNAIDRQLQDSLQTTWDRERRTGQVKVQLVMDGGNITAVQAEGMSSSIERSVRHAINDLDCGQQASAGPQIYRFRIDFLDPDDRSQRTAGLTRAGYRIALLND
ncbi:hypothetical protein [Roseateles sp.]|uniref:hypothetical protein n=1 Tax=Roseateles sp. TaxID=1971397 RepID=UPI0026009820|nr:hypothetical protein [Roseateles sp.]MBV8033880.1 hypothetical protein [Roseateles sp.]